MTVELADPKALQQDVWGQLPSRVRQQMQSRMVEQFLPALSRTDRSLFPGAFKMIVSGERNELDAPQNVADSCWWSCRSVSRNRLEIRCHADDFPARTDLDALYDKEVDEAIRKGLAVLVNRQNPDGSFLSNDWGRDAGVCALVGLALLSRGVRSGFGSTGKCLQRIGRYLTDHSQESGMVVVSGSPSHGQMYGHGFATLFLSELYGTTPSTEIRPKLSAAVELIARSQNEQGWLALRTSPL